MWRRTLESLLDVEDSVKYAQQYEIEEESWDNYLKTYGEELTKSGENVGKPGQSHLQRCITQRRDHDFFVSLRHAQRIPSMLVDLETYFALTCLGLADNLLHHVLLPVKWIFLGRKYCSTRDRMGMCIMLWCLFVYWILSSSTTQLYSYLYHAVRRTSFVKLVIIFSMLDVLDKALSSFSQDTLEILYAVVEDKVKEWNSRKRKKEKKKSKAEDEPHGAEGINVKASLPAKSSPSRRHPPNSPTGSSPRCRARDPCPLPPQGGHTPVTPSCSGRKRASASVVAVEVASISSCSSCSPPVPPRRQRREESPFHVVEEPPVFSPILLVGTGLAAMGSVTLHSLALLLTAVSLNVAVNSDATSFLALLVSNNFNELKSTIFKKYSAESLHALCVVDAIERLQYVFLFSVLIMQYITEHFNPMVIFYAFVILSTELFIDFSKLLFCCKFNTIPLAVFRSYAQLSLLDIAAEKVLWQLPEAPTVRVVKPIDPIPLAAPPPPIGQLSPSYSKLLFPSFGYAPKNVRRAGFDVLAYASLLLWCLLHAGAQLFCAAPTVLVLCIIALALAKLFMSTFITGLSARFVLRSLLEPRSEPAGGHAGVSARTPHTGSLPSPSPTSNGTTSMRYSKPPSQSDTPRVVRPMQVGELLSVPPPSGAYSVSLSPPSCDPSSGTKENEDKLVKTTFPSSSEVVLQLTPFLCALLKVDRFDLQAGKKK